MSTQRSVFTKYDDVPQLLKDIPNWVVWKLEPPKGKVPYDAKTNKHAKSNDSSTWATFQQAAEVADGVRSGYFGIGLVVRGVALGGVDFDGVLDDGIAEAYVLEILKHLGNPYCEISPSGNGLRAFFKVPVLPDKKGRKFSAKKEGVEKYGAEIYFGAESAPYLTVTGNRFSGDGIPTPQDINLVHFMISQFGNKKLKKLWMGDTSDFENDQSRADLALCAVLKRLLNNDVQKIEAYFSASKLGQRDKWTERPDYRERTIAAAISAEEPASTKPASKGLEFHRPAVTIGTHQDFVIAPAPGQKDGWFPLGDPSLIGGPSGSTKTTLMIQLLLTQSLKAPFFGHQTYGRHYLVLMFDRGGNALKRTMDRMNLNVASIPIKHMELAWGTAAAQEIINKIEETDPLPEIVFIEGCDMLVKDPNKMEVVAPFIRELQKIAEHYHMAIIGSVGSPKFKPGQGYIAKRDNLLGTVAWARACETVALLEFSKSDDTSVRRQLSVLPRNAPAEIFALELKGGQLEVQPESEINGDHSTQKPEQESKEIQWIKEQARQAKSEPTKEWWTILDLERALNMKHATAERHVKDYYTKGYIKKKTGGKNRGGRGKAVEYRWNESKTNPLWVEQRDPEKAEGSNLF